MAIPVVAEQEVKGAFFKDSGGGILYHAKKPFGNHLYKRVKHDHEMEAVWGLAGSWSRLQGTDWAAPCAFVSDLDGGIVGYIMRRSLGRTLLWHAERHSPRFPLPRVISRVVKAMKQGGILEGRACLAWPPIQKCSKVVVQGANKNVRTVFTAHSLLVEELVRTGRWDTGGTSSN